MKPSSVFAPRRLLHLVAADALNAGRDPVMLLATAMSLLPAGLLRLFGASIDDAAMQAFGVAALSRYLVPMTLVLPALLIGWVTGMLLLEDRDDGTAEAIAVTPLGRRGFLLYRATATAILAALLALAAAWLVLPDAPPFTRLVLFALVAAEAVMVAALLPALARNKVEGLALSKVMNLAAIVPLAAIAPVPWRYLAAPIPSYWLGELTLLPQAEALPAGWLAALAVHAMALAACMRLFRR